MATRRYVRAGIYASGWVGLGYLLWRLVPPSRDAFLRELPQETRDRLDEVKVDHDQMQKMMSIIKENAASSRPVWQVTTTTSPSSPSSSSPSVLRTRSDH
jgi:hypothetical protein